MNTLLTIGYRGRSISWLLRHLRQHRADALVDVREKPWSPEPAFRAPALSESLTNAGLAYVSLSAAGNPYRPPVYQGTIEECLRLYRQKVEAEGLARMTYDAIHRFKRPCLLCACPSGDRCHRGVLARAVAFKAGIKVLHLPADLQGSLFGGEE